MEGAEGTTAQAPTVPRQPCLSRAFANLWPQLKLDEVISRLDKKRAEENAALEKKKARETIFQLDTDCG